MYKVKAIMNFDDLLEHVPRKTGDEWKCTKERYEYLAGNNPQKLVAVELVEEELSTPIEEPKEEVKPKKKSKKK